MRNGRRVMRPLFGSYPSQWQANYNLFFIFMVQNVCASSRCDQRRKFMENAFVTIELSEDEYDQVLEWLGSEEISTGLGELYARLLAAAEERTDD
ncbi:MAG: hypothetical protein EBR82_46145 [Caulobacteraceae bacterium]|nr:hypothetical protein [Caulobacteraceae bacterium]